jgi:hypothetical protein
LVAVNEVVGTGFTVTRSVDKALKQPGIPGLTTCKLKVFTPAFAQLKVNGPIVPVGGDTHPSQFQVKTAAGKAEPVKFKADTVFCKALLAQTLSAVKAATGVSLIVTITVLIVGELQAGVPVLVTSKVSVFTPALSQLKLRGPLVTGFPPIQPSQDQLKMAPGKAEPV